MNKPLITPDDIHWFEPVFRAWECNDMPGVLESLESAIKQFIPNKDHGCDCLSCRITHASDCAVHNMPAMPNNPCDCGILDNKFKFQSNDIERVKFESPTLNGLIEYANRPGIKPVTIDIAHALESYAQLIAEQEKAEAFAYYTTDNEGTPVMLFFDRDEALSYCDDDEQPGKLYLHAAPSTDRVAEQGGDDALPFYAGDLFWPDDDGETCATDMCGLIQDLADNEQIESGQTLRIRRAKTLPTVEVVVTIDDEGDVDYQEALRATPADGDGHG